MHSVLVSEIPGHGGVISFTLVRNRCHSETFTTGALRHRVAALAAIGVTALAAGCAAEVQPTATGLVTAASAYWSDLSLRTAPSLSAAYGYLDPSLQLQCPEPAWRKAAGKATSFSDVQVSDPIVSSDEGRVSVTVTYLVVGFMERDPDLPTATVSSSWRWESSSWRVVSSASCATTP
jgi:hypothetical protein